jgi:hypothetical protein
MLSRTLSRFALLAAGLWTIQQLVHARRARHAVPARKPEAIESWEGEGGAVPLGTNRTAAAVTPGVGPRDLQDN